MDLRHHEQNGMYCNCCMARRAGPHSQRDPPEGPGADRKALKLKRCTDPAKKALDQVKEKVYSGGCGVVMQHRAQLDLMRSDGLKLRDKLAEIEEELKRHFSAKVAPAYQALDEESYSGNDSDVKRHRKKLDWLKTGGFQHHPHMAV
ncbi:hypothetical protein H632_c865p1, partial [Helicosporidium sp. ATCC 50920]